MRSIHPQACLRGECHRPCRGVLAANARRCLGWSSSVRLQPGVAAHSSFPFALRATPHPIAYRCRSVCADAHSPARPHARRCGFLRHAHAHAWPRARQRRASRPQCSRKWKYSRAQVWTLAASQPGVTGRPICNHCNGHDRGSTARLRQRFPKRTRVGGLGRHEPTRGGYGRPLRWVPVRIPLLVVPPIPTHLRNHICTRAHAAQRLAWPRRGRGRVWRHTHAEPNNLILKATRAGAHRSASALSRRR